MFKERFSFCMLLSALLVCGSARGDLQSPPPKQTPTVLGEGRTSLEGGQSSSSQNPASSHNLSSSQNLPNLHAPLHPTPGLLGFADIVQPLLPSVVNISVVKQVTTFSFEGPGGIVPGNPFGGGSSLDNPSRLREFLEKFHVAPKKRRLPVGVGSGFIISPEGHVVTNAHVVEGAHEVIVTLSDRSEMRAKVVGIDTNFDLALLKVTHDKPLPYVQWGDAKKMRIGDWAIAIGNPLGLGGSVTLGIISYVGRSFISQQNSMGGLFQTDAAINVGNSGGPLFNVEGKVIGINMMIASATGGNIGIGFAIPSDVAQFVINQLKEYGKVKRGWIGVYIQELNQAIAQNLKMKVPQGALVGTVVEKGPADQAGVKQTDVVLRVNNVTIDNASTLSRVISGLPIGTKVPMVVWRRNEKTGNFEEITLDITIQEFEDDVSEASSAASEKAVKEKEKANTVTVHGLTLQDLTPQLRKRYGLEASAAGVLVTNVDLESRASEAFQPGDLVLEVNQKKVFSCKEIQKQVKDMKDSKTFSILCLIQRQGVPFFVSFSMEDISKEEEAPLAKEKKSSLKSLLPKFLG